MKNRFEEVYKKLVKNSDIEPTEQIWESISNSLDLDKVWSNISNDLELEPFRQFGNLTTGISLASFLICFLLISFNPMREISNIPTYNRIDSQEPATSLEKSNPSILENSVLESGRSIFSSTAENRYDQQNLPNENLIIPDPIRQTHIISLKHDNNAILIYSDRGISLPAEPTLLQLSYKPSDESDLYSNIDNKEEKKSNIYMGVTGSLKNTWILNNKTISGFSSRELHTTKAVFGREFGFFIGSMVNNRMSILGEYYFTSNFAQAYKEYIGGHYITSSFNVDYSKINALVCYKIKPNNNYSGSIDFLLGPYFGILKNAGESFNQNNYNLTDNYKDHIFGLTSGVQKNYRFNEVFNLLLGLRLTYGFTNIYEGTPVIPASFRITHPAAISFSLGIKYNLSTK